MNIGIIGLGLMGGSIALAAKKNHHTIYGFDQSDAVSEHARKINLIDFSCPSIQALCEQSTLLVIAVPMGAYEDTFLQLAPHLQKDSIMTDCGSVKSSAIELAKRLLAAEAYARFVPAHPIAGKELSGCDSACGDLFKNCATIVCCDNQMESAAYHSVQNFWKSLGAKIVEMSAEEHDKIFATISHLPHILAYAIVNLISNSDKRDSFLQFSAGGFRDFTRIAGSHPTMWKDICMSNKANILNSIAHYQSVLNDISAEIKNDDDQALFQRFSSSKKLREQWMSVIDQ